MKCPFCPTEGSPPGIKRHIGAKHRTADTDVRHAVLHATAHRPAPTVPQTSPPRLTFGSTDDVFRAARRLMNEHGLSNWRFVFDRGVVRFGACHAHTSPPSISMSRRLTELNLSTHPEQIVDTILHEIAHALTPGHKHDAVWRDMCRRIGATPRARYDGSTITRVPRAWNGTCPGGHTRNVARRPAFDSSCGRCAMDAGHPAGTFNAKFRITWTKAT